MAISFEDAQILYDQNRFLELFRQTAEYWRPTRRLGDLSVDELILGGRLATRLGGRRVSRWLFRAPRNAFSVAITAVILATWVNLCAMQTSPAA